MTTPDLPTLRIAPGTSIQAAIEALNQHNLCQLGVEDAAGALRGTITDRALRQAILDRHPLDQPVGELLAVQNGTHPAPDPAPRPAGSPPCGRAVVMAGGFGTRLGPLTEATPKPMLPIGGRPVLEHIVGHLRDSGIGRITLATHFMPEKIRDHFGDGAAFGVSIDYVHESTPLGTAGALGLLDTPEPAAAGSPAPLLVVNGDLLTSVRFGSMFEFHREHDAALTVAARALEHRIPYGVLETDGPRITGLTEKPVQNHLINAGIYLLEPSVLSLIPPGVRFDMTDLIARLLAGGRRVVSFPLIETWLDIGKLDDYNRAQVEILEKGKRA